MTTTDAADLRPTGLDGFIGQRAMKEMLAVHMRSAVDQDRPLPHMLLTGPAGMGKTTLAQILADELGEPLLVTGRPLGRRLGRVLRDFGGGIWLIDEVHLWPRREQDALLTLLEEGELHTPMGVVKFPWLTVIAATTEREKIQKPLVSRFTLQPPVAPYTDEELALILDGMADRMGMDLPWETALALGRACGGVPRAAAHLVRHARAIADAYGREATVDEVLTFGQVQPDGLTEEHLAYLRYLDDLDGEAGLETMAGRMRQHPAVVKDLERLLLDRKLITLGRTGRQLTQQGRRRCDGLLDEPPTTPRRSPREPAVEGERREYRRQPR